MKVAIYCRVSTEEQDVGKQEVELKEFCARKSYEVVDVYTDVISGTKDSRPGLDQLMKDAYQKKFDAVIVWKIDRLGRSLQHLLKIMNDFKLYHIDLISVTQMIDTTTPQGKLMFNFFGMIAEFERELISERTKLGLKRAKNVGKRGKDKGRRKTGGYLLYWQSQKKKPNKKIVLNSQVPTDTQ